MSALKDLVRIRKELQALIADERPSKQFVGGRVEAAALLVQAARAEAHEEWHAEGQIPELVPASNAEVERYVRAVKDGAHASAEEVDGPMLKCPCGYHGPIGDPGDACPLCGADDRGVEVVPPGAAVIDPETTARFREALAADGRAHDAQVKRGPEPTRALICGCVTGTSPVICPSHAPRAAS